MVNEQAKQTESTYLTITYNREISENIIVQCRNLDTI